MKQQGIDEELFLEAGLLLFAVGLAAGGAAWLLSKAATGASRMRGGGEGAPPSGSVPPERHSNITTNAAR